MATQGNQAEMDITQYKKMVEAMTKDLRNKNDILEKEREEAKRAKEEAQRVKEEADRIMKEKAEMEHSYNVFKNERRQGFSQVLDTVVNPYLDGLKKTVENDKRYAESIDKSREILGKGLENAFTNERELAMMHTLQVGASANQALSSRVEELFQSQKEWENKFEQLKKEKEEIAAKKAEEIKAAQEAAALKEKMAQDLKQELETLKMQYEKSKENIKNTDSHFEDPDRTAPMQEGAAPVVPPSDSTAAAAAPTPAVPQQQQQQTVGAVASNDPHFYNGFNTLFDFTPRTSWRGPSNF
jgi:chromosome segregation ATPase